MSTNDSSEPFRFVVVVNSESFFMLRVWRFTDATHADKMLYRKSSKGDFAFGHAVFS